ncbi:MAG: sigma-70 family RNA polymerase sigma factor [Schwartzia sp.]|nr:sigma-70 family RNA polymerase sigma factor [Schwartzia sp. (in: firmicutes)]
MLLTSSLCPRDFEAIYREYHKKVYNYIYGQILHREAAEDLAADVFVAVATHLSEFNPARGSLTAWIFTIAKHMTLNYRMRASNRLEESRGDMPDRSADEPSRRDDSLRAPENVRAERILAQLSHEERRFLELRYVLDLSNEQVGRVIGATPAAVSQKYCRILAKCRKIDKDAQNGAP